jgi:cytochrome c553
MKVHYRSMALVAMLLAPLLGSAQETVADNDHVRRAVHVCAACHGDDGNSSNASFPRLAGQPADYVIAQLIAFRAQKRSEEDPRAYMWGVSALLDDATIKGLAAYYAAQTPGTGIDGDPALTATGRAIFMEGISAEKVQACRNCHGDAAEGKTVFPRLAGQHASYVYRQLKMFGTRLRPHGKVMADEVHNMSNEQLRAVAEYVQSR